MATSPSLKLYITILVTTFMLGCKSGPKRPVTHSNPKEEHEELLVQQPTDIPTPDGMVWVDGKTFTQGAKIGDPYAMQREIPAHQVTVDGFFMDVTEVTNTQFKAFVDATNYVTVAERPINWDDMKQELPEGTPKPHDSILQPQYPCEKSSHYGQLFSMVDLENRCQLEAP